MDLDLENVLNNHLVVLWSGGLDSTGLLIVLLEKYKCKIYPIFVKHGQDNEKLEEKAVDHYTKIFMKKFSQRFEKPLKVSSNIPAKEFKKLNIERRHDLRNSELINNAVRYCLEKEINTIVMATFQTDFPDGKFEYLEIKNQEISNGTDVKFNLISPFFDEKFPCLTKQTLIEYSEKYDYSLKKTWRCWNPRGIWYTLFTKVDPCGKCYPCKARDKAFSEQKTKKF